MLPCLDTYIGKSTHNFFIYTDAYHKRLRLLPWDLNACMGGESWLSESAKQKLSIWFRAGDSARRCGRRDPGRALRLAGLRRPVVAGDRRGPGE